MRKLSVVVPKSIKDQMSIFASFDGVPEKVDFTLYDRVEDVLAKYFTVPMTEYGEEVADEELELDGDQFLALPDGAITRVDDFGNEHPMSTEEMVENAKDQGFFGFFDLTENNLHVWVNVERMIQQRGILQVFLGHEIGHIYDEFIQGLHTDAIKEMIASNAVNEEVFDECRADCYGLTAYLSYEIANLIMSSRVASVTALH